MEHRMSDWRELIQHEALIALGQLMKLDAHRPGITQLAQSGVYEEKSAVALHKLGYT
uniref:Uncharacterized protein n=1 Tax=Anguilla anguilla TaxID=7936 RepID=A0A0E9SGF5_ANGAN